MKVSRQTISQQCEVTRRRWRSAYQQNRGLTGHPASLSSSTAHQPAPQLIKMFVFSFSVQTHLAKIKPWCFDFLYEPFYFPFRVFTVVGSLQKPIVHLCVVCVCSATLRPARFSVPTAHSAVWCVCAFLLVMFKSAVLSGCSCLALLGLAQACALLKTVNTLIMSQSTVQMPLKKTRKHYPHLSFFLPRHGC